MIINLGKYSLNTYIIDKTIYIRNYWGDFQFIAGEAGLRGQGERIALGYEYLSYLKVLIFDFLFGYIRIDLPRR